MAAPEIEKLPEAPVAQDKFDTDLVAHESEVTQKLEGLEGVLEKIERTPGQITSDDGKTTFLTPTQPQAATITIPLTQEQIKDGLHHKIMDSVRWLAVFSVRMIKKAARLGVSVVYKK